MAAKEKTSERFNVYSNKCERVGFDPDRGRTSSFHALFYTHSIPEGLNTLQCRKEIPRMDNMFIENGISTRVFDPVWGRTFFARCSFYKYAIPSELLTI